MVSNQKEIQHLDDIKLLVNTFYDKVRKDDLLATIFNNVIQDRWPQHLAKMYTFWQTVLLEEYTYEGSPFLPHAKLPVEAQHFDRWLLLFNATVDEFFIGEKAARAKWQGQRMAEMFLYKIQYHRERNSIPLI
ncbi:MAG: group III truncated hemoglobin [Bacteroidetes bacterium]|nr:group III truncated hemoglobin [Bacteroidota bacterium]